MRNNPYLRMVYIQEHGVSDVERLFRSIETVKYMIGKVGLTVTCHDSTLSPSKDIASISFSNNKFAVETVREAMQSVLDIQVPKGFKVSGERRTILNNAS